MKTARGIYYNLEESPYITKFKNFKFYFSSQFYRNKFETLIYEYIQNETIKFKNKYNVNIDIEEILSFNLYRKIEKRGCYCLYIPNGLNTFKITDTLNGTIQIGR